LIQRVDTHIQKPWLAIVEVFVYDPNMNSTLDKKRAIKLLKSLSEKSSYPISEYDVNQYMACLKPFGWQRVTNLLHGNIDEQKRGLPIPSIFAMIKELDETDPS
jgi:hypothetical protein